MIIKIYCCEGINVWSFISRIKDKFNVFPYDVRLLEKYTLELRYHDRYDVNKADVQSFLTHFSSNMFNID